MFYFVVAVTISRSSFTSFSEPSAAVETGRGVDCVDVHPDVGLACGQS